MKRRAFIKIAGMGAAAACLPRARVLGANNDLRVAVIGVGNQGSGHVGYFSGVEGVRVVALCDPDRERVDKRAASFKEDTGFQVDTYRDYREVLDRDDIDAVSIATCNHWHALIGIHACQAGKDVYVEKPSSQTVWEGRKLVEAADRTVASSRSGSRTDRTSACWSSSRG